MHWLDVTIILGFIAYAIRSGFKSKDVASQNLTEYFLAGKSLPGWKAGISMAATQFAADTPLLVTGLIATAGIFSLWQMWIYAIAFLMMGFLLSASWRKSNVLTDAELTEFRYASEAAGPLRGVKAIYFGTVFNCTVLAMVLLAATRIAEPFLLWNEWLPEGMFNIALGIVKWFGVKMTTSTDKEVMWILTANNFISIGVIVLVTMFYSTTGGLRSVVATDVMQFFMMMFATLCFAAYIIYETGGLSGMLDMLHSKFADGGPGGITPTQVVAFTPSLAKDITIPLLLVFALQWLVQMNADGTGYLAQRSMACRSDKDAKQAAIIFTVAQVFFRSLLWLPIGIGLMVIYPPNLGLPMEQIKSIQEATFVRGMSELLPVGLKGLMLTGMLAALASTVDTHLNWGSSYWTNDIYKRFVCQAWLKKEPSSTSLVWVARCANILILVIALVIMAHLESIQTAWKISLMLGAGMGIMLVLRWIWWRVTAWGELACIVASIILAPTLLHYVEAEYLRLLLMAIGSTAAGVIVSLLTGPEDMETLKKFYAQAQPPGFWGGVRKNMDTTDDAQKRFYRGVLATFCASLSFFSLLTGFGSIICGSPAPTWFPIRWLWLTIVILVGILLVPVWWRLGFKDDAAN